MIETSFLSDFGILSCHWPGSEDVNQQLGELALQKEKEDQGIRYSNSGGWHSKSGLESWKGECVQALLIRIDFALQEMMKYVEMDCEYTLAGAWANINRKGHYNYPHLHGFSWSGCYYAIPGEHDSGEIGFVKDVQKMPHGWTIDGKLSLELQIETDKLEQCLVKPKAGSLLVFPGHLLHYVKKYQGDDVRITIAFNWEQKDRSQ